MTTTDSDTDPAYDRIWREGWASGSEWMPVKLTQYRLAVKLFAKLSPEGRILDIGGGNGGFWEYAKRKGVDVNGLDITISDVSEFALEQASKKGYKTLNLDVTSKNPISSDNFDSICCFEVLEHIENYQQALANCFTAVCPGGKLYVSVPRGMKFWSKSDENAHHVRRFETMEILDALKRAGFTTYYWFTWGSPVFRFYQRLKGNMPPSFGETHKSSQWARLAASILHCAFYYEDWLPTNDGMFFYAVARKL